MAKTKVIYHQAAEKEIQNSAGVQSDLKARAARVLGMAQAIAPVESGEYRDNLHVEEFTNARGVKCVRVTSGTDHDIYVEADSGTLARALDAAKGA